MKRVLVTRSRVLFEIEVDPDAEWKVPTGAETEAETEDWPPSRGMPSESAYRHAEAAWLVAKAGGSKESVDLPMPTEGMVARKD